MVKEEDDEKEIDSVGKREEMKQEIKNLDEIKEENGIQQTTHKARNNERKKERKINE